MNTEEYKVIFYTNDRGKSPIIEYIDGLSKLDRAKILKFIDILRERKGALDEPYSKHIRGKIRELRIDFAGNKHRIFYFTFINKKIIMLHAFLKKTKKTPEREIQKAETNYLNVINNKKDYE